MAKWNSLQDDPEKTEKAKFSFQKYAAIFAKSEKNIKWYEKKNKKGKEKLTSELESLTK